MARYIDADVLMRFLHADDFGTPDERWKPESEFAQMIEATPTADVIKVKSGEWTDRGDGDWSCSKCGELFTFDAYGDIHPKDDCGCNFCPNCGAKMDGGEE